MKSMPDELLSPIVPDEVVAAESPVGELVAAAELVVIESLGDKLLDGKPSAEELPKSDDVPLKELNRALDEVNGNARGRVRGYGK